MISSRLHQAIPGVDVGLDIADDYFQITGLNASSVIRTTRLAVAQERAFIGLLGSVTDEQVENIKLNIIDWLAGKEKP
jgi:hypothetical protein